MSATQTILKVNQFINTLVCDYSSCALSAAKTRYIQTHTINISIYVNKLLSTNPLL